MEWGRSKRGQQEDLAVRWSNSEQQPASAARASQTASIQGRSSSDPTAIQLQATISVYASNEPCPSSMKPISSSSVDSDPPAAPNRLQAANRRQRPTDGQQESSIHGAAMIQISVAHIQSCSVQQPITPSMAMTPFPAYRNPSPSSSPCTLSSNHQSRLISVIVNTVMPRGSAIRLLA
ncbi:hypothetical protein ACLOJK_018843, partial [Asimina triloba]